MITLGALVTALTFAAYSYWRQHESQAMPFATWLRSRVTKCHPRALVHLAAIVLCAYLSLSTLAAVTRSAIAPTAADFWAVVVTGSAPLWAIFAASTTALVFFLLRACRRDWGYGLLLLLLCWTVSIVLATALVVLVAHERTGRAWAFWSELTGASQRLGVWPLARTVALAAFLAVPVAAWVAARKLRRRCTPWWLGLQAAQRSWIAGGAVAATLLFLLFCSFGANPGGLWDMVYTQLVWITRSSVEAETGQEKAFPYYLEILWTYERPIAALLMVLPVAVLAVSRAWRRLALALLCLGLAAAAWRSGMEAPALALLGVALLAASLHSAHSTFFSMWALVVLWIYSAIPYKTPWLLVNISLPLSLAAASLSSHLLTAPAIKGKAPVVALAAILCLGLVPFQAELGREGEPTEETGWWRMGWNLNFETPTDRRHPVVYHQTLPEVRELVALLEDLAQRDPDLVLHIVTNDYHPVPFYLHGRPIRLLYHIDAKLPDPLEPAMLIWQFQEPEVDQLGGRYHKERFEMRPGVVNTLMIAEERWAAAMEKDGS